MPPQNIRWLHLSDFHVGMDDYAQRKMFDYIVAHVEKRKKEGFSPDFIFITGDLADKGKSSDYETFWFEFLGPLQERIGNGITHRTFVIAGNHDVDRKLNPHFDRVEMAGAKSHCFDASSEGKTLRQQMLMPRFQAFADSDCTTVNGALGSDDGSFATTIDINGCKVGIAGINTAWLCKDNEDERKLTPGKSLLEHALGKLDDAQLRIVLGHHPIDWLIPAEQKPIKSLLGQHSVLYLHGHLHHAWAEPSYGGGHQFFAVQSGAAFQAREGEKWRNGLVWGEVDLTTQELKLQPRHWSTDHQDWTLVGDAFPESHRAGDWWIYPLPGTEIAKRLAKTTVSAAVQPPKGWATAKPDELQQHFVSLPDEAAIQYFNGAVPGWHTALSTSIPRRQIVQRLVAPFQNADASGRPIVTLLLAAGCEGKTTALLQSAYEVVKGKPDWQILRRADDAEPLKPSEILPVLSEQFRWLIVVDEADRTANGIVSFLDQLPHQLQGRVHFLIACRDSDWLGSKANELPWSSICAFQQERLDGLSAKDAEAIVNAWAGYGVSGLGDLAKVPTDKRASLLETQAHKEARTSGGAFFGALLAVRHGSDLPNHVRLMLERLGHRNVPSGGTLRDAFGYIAAMHSEGLEFLSRSVLAGALGCPSSKIHRDILAPLGQEAAATTTSSFVFTRHRRIAEAVVSVLEKDFAVDIGACFVSLAIAAIESKNKGEFVPDLPSWRYSFAEHFFDTGRKELALEVANAVLSRESRDCKTLVNLAKLYRKADAPEAAVKLFRKFSIVAMAEPSFYYEWSVCEGACGDQATSVVLAAFSICDACPAARVDNERAKRSLAGMGVGFGELFSSHHELAFKEARAAVAVLGQQLRLDVTTASHLKRHLAEANQQGAKTPTVEEAFRLLQRGVVEAESVGVNKSIRPAIPQATSFDFEGLKQLINASIKA